MRMLVLGGTRFVGRAVVEAALQAGHEVAMFNRGSDRDSFPEVRRLIGDRDNAADVAKLAESDWDCVVDVSAYHPSAVRATLAALGDRVPHHVFVSTISVYADPPMVGADESAPLTRVNEDTSVGGREAYGGLKVLCEETLREALGDRLTVLRPTIVVGPHDYTDRFTWYVRAVARGGVMPVPRRLEQPLQLIDAADFAAFTLLAAEQRLAGTFNMAGPSHPLTLGGAITAAMHALNVYPTLEPTDDVDRFPMALAPDGSEDGHFTVSIAAALAAGLVHTPLAETVGAIRAWDVDRGEPPLAVGPPLSRPN